MTIPRHLLRALFALFVFQLCAAATAEATFTVRVTIVGKGVVNYNSYALEGGPGPNGILDKSGSVKIEEGTYVYFTFRPEPGYRLEKVTDTADTGHTTIAAVAAAVPGHSIYVYEDHLLVVQFAIDSPIGTFNLGFKEGTSATPIADVTGGYSGVLPVKKNPYTLDVAMDESGKLIAMGTVNGFTNSTGPNKGTNEVDLKGSLKTLNNVPTASGSAATAGTLNGEEVKGSGSGKLPIVLTPAGGGSEVQGVVASGSGTEGDTRFTQKATMTSVPAQPENVQKAWNLSLNITEKTDAKGKKYVVASSILNLPNGDKTQFKEKKVTYSLLRGYSINFTLGVKLDAGGMPILDPKGKPVIDRKSRIAISKMLLQKNGATWSPIFGFLKYKFLGQTGQGDLVDFL